MARVEIFSFGLPVEQGRGLGGSALKAAADLA
jgi:hypothetical protein